MSQKHLQRAKLKNKETNMPRMSEARRNQTARSGSSSHNVVDVEMADGSRAGSADEIGFCIFRVPQSLAEINQMAYQPNTVSIGPYHHGKPQFQKIQEHKRRFSIDLLNRTNQRRDKLKHFAEALKPMEEKVRKCYSEVLAFNRDELIEMMVLDGCFIIELFCKYYRKLAGHTNPGHDPLLTEPWVLPNLMRDLAKLENQIPWFILKRLFDLTLGSWNESHPSLPDLALSFFNRMAQRPKDVLKKYSDSDWDGEHLLNFLRLTNNPDSQETKQKPNKFLRLVQPASKLHQAGIKFKPTHCESFMDIKFSNGVLEIPVLKFDDFMSSLFLNFIAFEQCHRGSSKHVTTYATFMACLLNTPADAGLLCNRKIIERYFGTDEKIAHFFSNIGKDVVFDIHKNYLYWVFEGVNRYNKDWRVHWASLKNTYFNTRWSVISASRTPTDVGIGCCIFRVPQSRAKIDQMVYQPNTVPIGPYHHGKPQFQKIQEHKRRFSNDLLKRTNQRRDKLKHFAQALKPMEGNVRQCYSEVLAFNRDELIEMMVLDGCFIIELFCKYYRKLAGHTDPGHDRLLTEPWVLPYLMRDLVKLENQIPWFILKSLFDLTLGSWNESHPTLPYLALSFFNRMVHRPKDFLKKYSDSDWDGEHLLNFLRLTNNPDSQETKQKPNKFLRLVQPASKLHQAGFKFKPTHCESFMDIKFSNGVLEIPVLKFDDFMSSLFLNFIAFEQCHRGSSKHVTTYATFMACLLNTPADAGLLCDRKIIERYFGTDEKIAHFFSNIGKDVVFDIHKNYLCWVFEGVNRYNEKDWRVHWASLKNTYFNTRWSVISAVAAFILLALATIQSFFAVYAYYRPPSNSNH